MITLGLLALEAREAVGQTRQYAAQHMGINYRTLGNFEHARIPSLPNKTTMRAIEMHYGWRQNAIQDVWDRRRKLADGELGLQDLLAPAQTGIIEARHLTDEQLIHELTFRLIMRQSG